MYTTAMNPWQSSGFTPQQQYFAAQSFFPYQTIPSAQAFNMPMQSSPVSIPSMGYSQPYMFSPGGNIQTGVMPQGAISFGFNPNWNMQQPINTMMSGQSAQLDPQMHQLMHQQMDQQLHQQMYQGLTTGIRSAAGFTQPRVELAETNNDVIVTADLPNVDPNNIYVTVTDDSLSISAMAHMGGISSSVHRTVALPTNVRSEHLDVSYTNGILECRLPKSDLMARRRVRVNATG
jgi:HSP20 family protein